MADDHAAARLGVRTALEDHGVSVVAEASDARGAVEMVMKHTPDLCLLDVNMPGGGVAAAAEINAKLPKCPIVMLTVSASDEDLFSALRAGARGYLLKDMDPDRLHHALREVLSGEAPLPRALTARLIDEYRERGAGRRVTAASGVEVALSERESEVLGLLGGGVPTSTIAERLGISAVTVRRHVSEILRKLGADDREAAVRLLRA